MQTARSIRGQESLDIALNAIATPAFLAEEAPRNWLLTVIRATSEELAAHAAVCQRFERESKGQCVWLHATA